MSKKESIVTHGLLKDHINYAALIEAQAMMPTFDPLVKSEQPKVKTLGTKAKTPYKKQQHK